MAPANPSASSRTGPGLLARIARHRTAWRGYDHLVPRADPLDRRFLPGAAADLGRWQRLESEYRLSLIAHPVRSFDEARMKARYMLTYPGSDYLISGPEELALFLRAMEMPGGPASRHRPGAISP
ncbi:hypothetical protein [Pelagibacterium halotolerans]|uniref:hypothetical protein n=1 Tax=Pelagibacterium halotolerans TaxID=531813 RepID=UPI0038516125